MRSKDATISDLNKQLTDKNAEMTKTKTELLMTNFSLNTYKSEVERWKKASNQTAITNFEYWANKVKNAWNIHLKKYSKEVTQLSDIDKEVIEKIGSQLNQSSSTRKIELEGSEQQEAEQIAQVEMMKDK